METDTTDTTTAAPAAASDKLLFSWPDYLVFAISLAIPLAIGIFFWIQGLLAKKQSTEDFLMGGRSINFVAVSLSVLASILNGIFVIGTPAEIHYYGIRTVYSFFGLLIGCVIASHVFVVRYQAMFFTSAYEIIFLAVVLYVPALALQQVTNLSIYYTILITGVICTAYTTIGGLKAVVWTDALQMVILIIGLILVASLGSAQQGGSQAVWDQAIKDGRINFIDFNPDPRRRTSFWSQTLGTGVVYIGLFVSNQMIVQRYMAVSSPAKAQSVLWIALIMFLPLLILTMWIGLVVHSKYRDCDPILTRKIASADRIVPFFIMDLLGSYQGIPGLLMSSIFAAALSSVSSVINALSAVVLEDFISPFVMYRYQRKLEEKTRKWIAVGIVIFFGAVTMALSFVADKFTTKLVQATTTIWGVIGGPLAGIFIMGFLFPFCNAWGAISGMFGGLIIALWICVGNLIYAPGAPTLPLGTCNNKTMVYPDPLVEISLSDWYTISYAWYGVIGTGSCMIIGIIVSLITRGYQLAYREAIKPSLMFSVADNCCCCCPLACIQCYRCGVNFEDEVKQNQVAPLNDTDSEIDGDISMKKNGVQSTPEVQQTVLPDVTILETTVKNGPPTNNIVK